MRYVAGQYPSHYIDKVLVNGNEIECVAVADTDRGEVIFYPQPLRVMKNKDEVYSRKLKGVVEVVFVDDNRG
jgi:hypothetical protein